MPDFDVDFDERRRGEVIRYVTEKYGEERVAQIVTYGTIKAKQAVKDAARVMGYPFAMGEKLTKAMPPADHGQGHAAVRASSTRSTRATPRRRSSARSHDEDPQAKEVVETALGLEGLKRQWGVHAAGVIMTSEPLIDLIPIMRREQDGQIITQFDYPSCETLGLVKMDFLGLRNLTILDDALANVQANRGEEIDLDALSKDMTDPATYELLGARRHPRRLPARRRRHAHAAAADAARQLRGHLGGARALPARADGRQLAHQLRAAQEPASRRSRSTRSQGAQPEPLAPTILGTTYGLIVYQEQVMQIAQKLAGYTPRQGRPAAPGDGQEEEGGARRRVRPLLRGDEGQRLQPAAIKALWDVLVPFSDYAFNKAHTAAYGLVSYWTAYLKANYPAEYMAALLTSVRDDKDKSALYLNECRRMGIKVLPPDVNESDRQLRRGRHRHPVRHGRDPQRRPQRRRGDRARPARRRGAFTSFKDFLRKVPAVVCNKRTIESLIKGGAFDSLGETRHGPAARCTRRTSTRSSTVKRQEAIGQDSLFGAFGDDAGDGDAGLADVDGPAAGARQSSGTRRPCSPSSARCSGSTSPTTRCSASSTSSPARRHLDRRPDRRRAGKPDGLDGDHRRADHGPADQADQEGRPLGHRDRRGPRGRDRVPVLPQLVHDGRAAARAATSCASCAGRVDRRDDTVSIYAQELTLPGHQGGPARPGGRDAAARPGHRRAWPRRSRRCWASTRAPPRCTSG